MRLQLHAAYLAQYLDLTGHNLQDLAQWEIPVAAARLAENIPGERERLLRMLSSRMGDL